MHSDVTVIRNPESKQPQAHTARLLSTLDLGQQEAASTWYHRASKMEPGLLSSEPQHYIHGSLTLKVMYLRNKPGFLGGN